MEKPTMDGNTALDQAGSTSVMFHRRAYYEVQELYGEDLETEHPAVHAQLVVALIEAQSYDLRSSWQLTTAYEIAESLENISDALRSVAIAMTEFK